jgi:hypothetical protein
MAIKAIVDKIDDIPEQYRDLYTEKNGKFELTGVEGVKTQADVERIQAGLVKERNEHKATKQLLSAWGDRKPDEVLAILDRVPELEAAAAGKVDENKINQMVETRVGSKLAPVQRQVTTLSQQLAERDQIITGYKQKEITRAVHDNVRAAISGAKGFQGSAAEDALMLAERMFEVGEDGKVITKEGVGVTPGVDAVVWLTEMQQKRPHWWGPTEGGGSGGSGRPGGGGSGDNPWSHAGWNMTKQGQVYRENPARAEQMAKAAGTTIGGGRPAAKK